MYEEYIQIREQQEILAKKEAELKAKIMEDIGEKKKTEVSGHTFVVASRKNYKYSPVVTELEDMVKIKKIEEVEKNIAEVSITTYLTYK